MRWNNRPRVVTEYHIQQIENDLPTRGARPQHSLLVEHCSKRYLSQLGRGAEVLEGLSRKLAPAE